MDINIIQIKDRYQISIISFTLFHKLKDPNLFLKLDISKAFDTISWPFLFEVLSHVGFSPRWCKLVGNILSSASTRIILNGHPGDQIQHRRGLRQGDPLSPMLFVLAMDVLNSLFCKAGELGLLQPLAQRNRGQRVSLYADDVTLFIKPVEEDMIPTREILQTSGEALGLKINFQKSCVIPIRCEEVVLTTISGTLHCAPATFPCTYLGLPISDKKLHKADLMAWVDKVGDRLPGWKASLMNLAGRVTWVHFVLSAIPIYVLVAIKVPKWFLKAINKFIRAFVWKGRKEVNGGACLVAWDKVQRPIKLGGLGILDLEIMSCALQIR
jgi:hypothetical protein